MVHVHVCCVNFVLVHCVCMCVCKDEGCCGLAVTT